VGHARQLNAAPFWRRLDADGDAGCDAIEWIPETGILACDCHSSEFDVRANGRVVGGPATRALPPLPLKIDRTVLVVATPFATAIRFDE